jgi:hypothetical protein
MNIDRSSSEKKRTLSSVVCPKDSKATTATTQSTPTVAALGPIIAVLAQEGWLDGSEVCVLERLCRDSKRIWCSDEAVWKPLVLRTWPHLIATLSNDDDNVTGDNNGKQKQQQRRPVIDSAEVESYKSIICNAAIRLTKMLFTLHCSLYYETVRSMIL